MNNKLLDFIDTEILKQEKLSKPNYHYINNLHKIKIRGKMTLNDFINTGMMMTVEDIEENFGKTHSLDEKTKDVMRYAGDIYIQYLPESEWCYMSQTWLEVYSGKLSDVEKRVWENVIKPLINNL